MELPMWPPLVALALGLIGYGAMVVYSKHLDKIDREEEEQARRASQSR